MKDQPPPALSAPNPLRPLQKTFASRDAMRAYISALSRGEGTGEDAGTAGRASPIEGGRAAGLAALALVDPPAYAASRNHLDGAVSRLSAYIRHGVLSLDEVRNHALDVVDNAKQAEKFIQELAWRDYWQRIYAARPDMIWHDVEAYKTGFDASEYDDNLPDDVTAARTGVACIDAFIVELLDTGYLHNHARLYLAGYIVHWRRVTWQAGARWFLQHLVDGDPASNNLSWQWVASTFANKPYFFNLETVARFAGPGLDVSPTANEPLAYSYEQLEATLFPHKSGWGNS